MCLKQLVSYTKWVLNAILFLTLNFDTTFLPECTKFCSVFSGYWIGNFMRVPKRCLKH